MPSETGVVDDDERAVRLRQAKCGEHRGGSGERRRRSGRSGTWGREGVGLGNSVA
jgi:hypothetical protein